MTHFAGAYPDVMENRVKVLFTEVNQEVIDLSEEISNSPIFVFEQGEIPIYSNLNRVLTLSILFILK